MPETNTLILSAFSDSNPDQLLASAALARLLAGETSLAEVFMCKQELLDSVNSQLGTEYRSLFLQDLPEIQNRLHLSNVTTPVENLSWRWRNNALELELTTEDGSSVNVQDIRLSSAGAGYDQVIFLGLDSVDAVKTSLEPYQTEILNGAETVALLFGKIEGQIAHKELTYERAKTYAQLVWQYAKEEKLRITPEAASLLLAGTYLHTANLTNEHTNPDIVHFVAELMEAGGKLDLLLGTKSTEAQSPETIPEQPEIEEEVEQAIAELEAEPSEEEIPDIEIEPETAEDIAI